MPPAQKPGNSEQDVQTPPEFLKAVKGLLGPGDFTIDLAASHNNRVVDDYYSEANSALDPLNHWYRPGNRERFWSWCNPPYAKIEPWVRKAYEQRARANVAMLVPAGVGSNWFRDWVNYRGRVLYLNPRLTFVGHTASYPKDLMLILTGPAAPAISQFHDVWEWQA